MAARRTRRRRTVRRTASNPIPAQWTTAKVRRVGSNVQVMLSGKHTRRNPDEFAGLNMTWVHKGRAAAASGRYSDMYDAWHAAKSKPKTSGLRVTAQESFYQGFITYAYRGKR